MNHALGLGFLTLVIITLSFSAESSCKSGCDLALASYYVWPNWNLTFISLMFDVNSSQILAYTPSLKNQDFVLAGTRVNVPFSCDCISGSYLGHQFMYDVNPGDTYDTISSTYYSSLTTVESLQSLNPYDPINIPNTARLTVVVNCSCGDKEVSPYYGLFLTYPLRPNETLDSIATGFNLSRDLLQKYNPRSNFSAGTGRVYIPGQDANGTYPPFLNSSAGISGGVIAVLCVVSVVVVVSLAVGLYYGIYRKRDVKEKALLTQMIENHSNEAEFENGISPRLPRITVDKSVEFSYAELATATENFSLANKIGEGGFGAVYYAELRGEKAAIKKMDMQATNEFLAELKVLTNVHHLNLVRLIGYCIEGSLFLVYEFIENGNISQHLRGTARAPLSWPTRVQIALDSARGLEYIHEHTVPVYIHRDIKSANILIDKNFHAKVADFGLAKLTEVGNMSVPTRLVGTFGYMAPEYAQYGDVSPKVDVYAFGVVLYELISAKEAIVKTHGSDAESKGLVGLFEGLFSEPNPKDELPNVIDPRLADNYPLDSAWKMAHLAKACTHENHQLRPTMRSIVVALMTLSSVTDDWDVGSFYENQGLANLMSGR